MKNPLRDLRATGEEGLSLIELMIAMFILGVALIALVGVAGQSLVSLRATREREQATNAASAAIEQLRERDWSDIALPPDATAPADVVALGGCFETEPIVQNAITDPIEYETTAGDDGRITVRTIVTWADGSCTTPLPTDNKRVVAVATWSDRGLERTVRQETLVAQSARGLPVPEFEVAPKTKTIILSDDGSAHETCGRHQVRNLGAADSYDWALARVVGDPGTVQPATPGATGGVFTTPDTNWSVRAYFESPAQGTSDVAAPDDLPTGAEPMWDSDNNGRPEALDASGVPITVAAGETANIWVCWQADDGVPDGTEFQAEIDLHSRFDENRTETVTQTVRIGFTGTKWFLYDPNDAQQHDRAVIQRIQGKNVEVYPPYAMGPQTGIAGSIENLGTANYALAAESDWDRDVDAGDAPGVRLVRDATNGTASIEWHEQLVAQTTTFSPTMVLELWVSTADVLARVLSDGESHGMGVSVVVERLNKNESTVEETIATSTATYSFSAAETGWKKLTITLSAASAPVFNKQEFLSVRVTCLSTSEDDCAVAYDNTSYPSALTVVQQ